ncbi:MAG TPA: hypothetical protein VKT74_08730 [Gammaproteobacteria bacterium]|nr:hypothetical protein [Gammaproteobacteria bacterium]
MKDEDGVYWLSLGRFIEYFSITELALFLLLAKSSDFSDGMAKAVFGDKRASEIMDATVRVWIVNSPGKEIEAEFEDVFAQMRAINAIRSTIVHHISSYDEKSGRIVSDSMRQLRPQKVRRVPASPEFLKELAPQVKTTG